LNLLKTKFSERLKKAQAAALISGEKKIIF